MFFEKEVMQYVERGILDWQQLGFGDGLIAQYGPFLFENKVDVITFLV